MASRLPGVLSAADLPEAELCAARLDGDLFTIADGFSPIDVPEHPAGRAQSLMPQLNHRLIVELMTAAWVYGATPDAPSVHQFCSAADARAKPPTLRGLTVREVVIDDDEIVTIGGVRLTSPLRTACDLVRVAPQFDTTMQRVVLFLLDHGQVSVADCAELLGRRRNLPGKRRTLARLRSVSLSLPDQPLLTR